MALRQCKKRRQEQNPKTNTKFNLRGLPEDVLMDIFSRLPLFYIINFRHAFPNIVSCPEFERLYHKTRHSSTLFVVVNSNKHNFTKERIYEYHHDVHHIVSTELNFTDLLPRHENRTIRKSEIVGCDNSLLLVLHQTTCYRSNEGCINSLHLVNPITRRSVSLIDLKPPVANFGLGYSSTTRLYKVVHLAYNLHLKSVSVLTVDLINTDNNCWRNVTLNKNNDPQTCNKFEGLIPYVGSRPFALCGAIYWLVRRQNLIPGFDVDKEEFNLVPMPPHDKEVRPTNRVYSQLNALGGSLCVLEARYSEQLYHVWVMKEHGVKESWKRVTTINLDKNVRYPVFELDVIDFLENGMLLIRLGPLLRLYDPEKQVWDNKKGKRLSICMQDTVITNFVPSLLSLV